MAKVILIGGKIGSGKTTYARKLCRKNAAILLSADELMLTLFGQHCGDRHDEYAAKTKAYLLSKALELLAVGTDVVLDWGFWRRDDRCAIREYFRSRGLPTEFHYIEIGDEQQKIHLERRNAAVLAGTELAYYVDAPLAAKAAGRFEEPDEDEIDVRIPAAGEEQSH